MLNRKFAGVLAATLLLIPVLILEADAEGGWLTFAYFANWVIWFTRGAVRKS